MIKQEWVVQCDLCGKVEKARMMAGQYNELNPTLPEGWKCGHNVEVHLCRECAMKAGAGKP